MDTILREIDPDWTLSETELSIQTFEAKGAEFVKSNIQPHDGRITNNRHFQHYDPGPTSEGTDSPFTFLATTSFRDDSRVEWRDDSSRGLTLLSTQ